MHFRSWSADSGPLEDPYPAHVRHARRAGCRHRSYPRVTRMADQPMVALLRDDRGQGCGRRAPATFAGQLVAHAVEDHRLRVRRGRSHVGPAAPGAAGTTRHSVGTVNGEAGERTTTEISARSFTKVQSRQVGSHDGVRSPHARPVTCAGNASRLGTGRRVR
ncbi:hypothetical protein FRAHR75_1280009 [Frankia sp. Hr75.2]|nr:hypothetical protein FRAHR75_1280009 [Frankia sp. Hr75.2]